MRSTSGNPDGKEENPGDEFMFNDDESLEARLYAKLYYSSETFAEPNPESFDNTKTMQKESAPVEMAHINAANNVSDTFTESEPSTVISPVKSTLRAVTSSINSEPQAVTLQMSPIDTEANVKLTHTPKTNQLSKKALRAQRNRLLKLAKKTKKTRQKERKEKQKLRKSRDEYISLIGNRNQKTNSTKHMKDLRERTTNQQNKKGCKRYSLRPTIPMVSPTENQGNKHFYFADYSNIESDNEEKNEKEQNSPSSDNQNISFNTPSTEPLDIIEISSSSDSESEVEIDAEVKKVTSPKAPTRKSLEEKKDSSDSDSDSDSDGSVFEVPVPPKPQPVLIDLDESGKESDEEKDMESSKDQETCDVGMTDKENNVIESCSNIVTEQSEVCVDSDDTFLHDEASRERSVDSLEVSNRGFMDVAIDDNAMDSITLNSIGAQNAFTTMDDGTGNDLSVVEINDTIEINDSLEEDVSIAILDTPQVSKKRTSETIERSNSVMSTPLTSKTPTFEQTERPNSVTNTPLTSKKRNFDQMEGANMNMRRLSLPLPIKKKKEFYDNSWGGENFELDQVMGQMSRDRRRWTIMTADITGKSPKCNRYWKKKCRICHNDGHESKYCTEPKKMICCHMCGALGHKEMRCPYKMCLTCGQKQWTYSSICHKCRKMYCTTCKSVGHNNDKCPDLWRQYHSTTNDHETTLPKVVTSVMKSKQRQYCCNCGKKGHESYSCNGYRWSQHFPTPAFVTHYRPNFK